MMRQMKSPLKNRRAARRGGLARSGKATQSFRFS
jgi:hypothetical protein